MAPQAAVMDAEERNLLHLQCPERHKAVGFAAGSEDLLRPDAQIYPGTFLGRLFNQETSNGVSTSIPSPVRPATVYD